MTKTGKYQRRRAALFREQNGKCWWCPRQMVLMERPSAGTKRFKPPLDMCTLDHLFDRFHPDRRKRPNGERRYVAACWECNQRRGREREAQISKKTLNRRSGRHPRRDGPERVTYGAQDTAGAVLADVWPRMNDG